MNRILFIGMMFLGLSMQALAQQPGCEEAVQGIKAGMNLTLNVSITNLMNPEDTRNETIPLKVFLEPSGIPCPAMGSNQFVLKKEFKVTYRSKSFAGVLTSKSEYLSTTSDGPVLVYNQVLLGIFTVHHAPMAVILQDLGFETFEPNGTSYVQITGDTNLLTSPTRNIGLLGVASQGEKLYQIVITQTSLTF